ncbi:MAG: tetratricopeptide repeat protein [Candidatus Tectomicrobia bacterium]|nr:tetratricopeptide repeat protein [Candidatus Tectomicrobia bacterium]
MKMRARAANREAARNFDEALDALDHLPPDEANLKKKIDIRFEIRNSLQYLGEFEKIKKNLDETLPLAEELGEPTRLGKLYSFLCSYYLRIGRSEFARQWGERGLDLARRSGDETSQVVAHYFLGQCCQIPGKYLQAIEHLKKAESFTRGENVGNRFGMANPASILIRSELVPALAEIGEFEEAISEGKEAVRIATALEHRIGHVLAYFGTGSLFLRKGDFQKAIDVLEKGLSIVRETHSFLWLPGASSALGYAYGLAGNTQEALSLLEEAVHVAESMNFLRWQPLRVAWLAEIHLLAGETGKAVALAASALNQARDQEEWGSHARALRLLGEIHSHPDSFDSEKAETHYRRALALAEELGMRPLQAHCHAGLGRLCQKTGREEEARTELDQAVEMYRDMGMDFFLRQAEAALAG